MMFGFPSNYRPHHDKPKEPVEPEPEPDRAVIEWRYQQLVEAGWEPLLAEMLAVDLGVDLHVACDLMLRGCPVERAWEILN